MPPGPPFQAGFVLATLPSGIRRSCVPSMGRGLTEASAAVLPVEVGPGIGGTPFAFEASAVFRPGCGLTLPKSGSPCGFRVAVLQPLVMKAKVMKPRAIHAAVGKRGVGVLGNGNGSIEGFLLRSALRFSVAASPCRSFWAAPLTALEDPLRARLFRLRRRVAVSPCRFFLPILTCFR